MFQKFEAGLASWLSSSQTAEAGQPSKAARSRHGDGRRSAATSEDSHQTAAGPVAAAEPVGLSRSPSEAMPPLNLDKVDTAQARGKRKAEDDSDDEEGFENLGLHKSCRHKVDNAIYIETNTGECKRLKELSSMQWGLRPLATPKVLAANNAETKLEARWQRPRWLGRAAPPSASRHQLLKFSLDHGAPELEDWEEGEPGNPATLASPAPTSAPAIQFPVPASAAPSQSCAANSPAGAADAKPSIFNFAGSNAPAADAELSKPEGTPPSIKALRRRTSKANLSQLAQESPARSPTSCTTGVSMGSATRPSAEAAAVHSTSAGMPATGAGAFSSGFTFGGSTAQPGAANAPVAASKPSHAFGATAAQPPASAAAPGPAGTAPIFAFGSSSAQPAALTVPPTTASGFGAGTAAALAATSLLPGAGASAVKQAPTFGTGTVQPGANSGAAGSSANSGFSFGNGAAQTGASVLTRGFAASNDQPKAEARFPGAGAITAAAAAPGTGLAASGASTSRPANLAFGSSLVSNSAATVQNTPGPSSLAAEHMQPGRQRQEGAGHAEPNPFTNATAAATAGPFSGAAASLPGSQAATGSGTLAGYSTFGSNAATGAFGGSVAGAFGSASGPAANPFSSNSAALPGSAGTQPGAKPPSFAFGNTTAAANGPAASTAVGATAAPAFGSPTSAFGTSHQTTSFSFGGSQATASGGFAFGSAAAGSQPSGSVAFGATVSAASMSQPSSFAFGGGAPNGSQGSQGAFGSGMAPANGFGPGAPAAFGASSNAFAGSQATTNPFGGGQQNFSSASTFSFGQPAGAQSAPSMGAAQAVPNFGGAGMTMGGTGALNGSRRRLQVRRNR